MRDTRRARLFLGLLLAMALVIVTVDHRARGTSPFATLREVGAWAIGGVQSAVSDVVRPVGRFFSIFTSAPSAQERIAGLKAENARLRAELSGNRLDQSRSAELRRMLGVTRAKGYKVVPAQVVARRGLPGFEDAVEIDVGTRDGVRSEMTVLNDDGLVGRVLRAGTGTSTVVLLSDPASAAGARLEEGNEVGVVNGVGEHGRLVKFKLLDATATLAPGQRVVSFGSQRGAPYIPGVPIGVIERVESTPGELTRTGYARPYADLTSLDVVGVVVGAPQRDVREAVPAERERKG
ncbi:rod shape-determining protein MreC [Sinosporangium siamense]|uniref:Cell shape-determining protein MreC n=1 Tax=Sinosporangium siamense TaxID=1367973 RepID=A0A919VGM1_9ACTN|nr:rod shape-determining protein MreC [Sinosporangium siamense]GII97249.1 rod shape-determining protein MreC [Sinosporangium siamense]